MPQVEGGPKGLNEILEAAYSSALSQGKDKASASAIAWSAAKNKYKKRGDNWVAKLYDDLSFLVVALNKVVGKSNSKDFAYLHYPIQMLSEKMKKINQGNTVEYLNIDDLLINPNHNPVEQESIENCKDEIKASGKVKPIIYSYIDNDGVDERIVTDGYHRYIAMKELGYTLIPARLSDERGTKTTELDAPVNVMIEQNKTDDADYLGSTEKFSKADTAVDQLPVDGVFLNPYHTPANRSIVEEKKQKIQATGKVKPLLYSEIDNNGKVEHIIVDGYHRFIALKELGYTTVPAKKVDERGLKVSEGLPPVPVKKDISSTPVDGLGLVRQDLQGKIRKPHRRIQEAEEVKKGGEGSGCNPQAGICGRPSTGASSVNSDWMNSKTHKAALDSANAYNKKVGLPEISQTEEVKVNPDNGKRIAEAYSNLKSDPSNPEVQKAYAALGSEVNEQYKGLPAKIEFTKDDPYKTSDEMKTDLENNNRLKVFTGGEEHPLLGQKDENGVSLNDKFRAVHDYYGHAMFGHKFSPSGEENAWMEHSKMFSPEAQKALTTETRGQNSWFNFSKENEGKAPHDRQFAEQKVGILPDEFLPKNNTAKKFEKLDKGGPGSGRHAEGKAFDEPFHSGNHVQQFLGSNNVVIGSVDKGHLSPEKNALRQQEFEQYLKDKNIPYKKGTGNSSEWGNETSYIVHAPEPSSADAIKDQLHNRYKQDSVISVRNAHATLESKGSGKVQHANINGNLESGDHLTDNYTNVDGQKFRINFK